MATSLLATKLSIPALVRGLIPRPRLVQRIRGALTSSLTVVSAPAGFGKTTLVREWVQSIGPSISTAWLSLEASENDPVRFWDYFIAALQTKHPSVGKISLTLLHSSERVPAESFLAQLVNDLSSISDEFVLVLDDYHLIESHTVNEGLTFFLEHMPPKIHLVISARIDPPLPLPHLRGKGTMLELGADDLRFTFEEATGLLSAMLGPALSAEHVKALNERTEGWAVGLKMAALSIGERKDVDGFISAFTGSHRYIMDYLIEEVLKRQTDAMKDFLLKTSVLERFNAPLCDCLTGFDSGQKTLARLESSLGGFLVPLDESRQWYRYHHLFAELLRHELEAASGQEGLADLRLRASQWYEDNGFPNEAIEQALAARDWERAMQMVARKVNELMMRGEIKTLSEWLQAIPEDVLRRNHRLYGQYALVLARTGRGDAATAAVDHLEKIGDTGEIGQGELAFYRAMVAIHAQRPVNFESRIALTERALALLPLENLSMRAVMTLQLGVMRHNQSRFDEALLLMTDAREMARQLGDLWSGAVASGRLSNILYLQGRLRESLAMAQDAVDFVGHSPAALMPLTNVFLAHYEVNHVPEAERAARLGVELAETSGQISSQVAFYFWLAFALLAKGDVPGADAAMGKSDEMAHLIGQAPAHAGARVIFGVLKGDLESALEWGKKLSKYQEGTLDAGWQHVPAMLLIAKGEKAAASEMLRGIYDRTVRAGAYGCLVRARIYQAMAADNPDEALAFLADALARGEPEHYIRIFADEPKLLEPLLRQALGRGIMPQYTSTLLNVIDIENLRRKAIGIKGTAGTVTPQLLSQRELEVLGLIADGLSNQQIAEKLSVSLNTAKTHVHHLFDKLEAKDRLQAVARARDLKLI